MKKVLVAVSVVCLMALSAPMAFAFGEWDDMFDAQAKMRAAYEKGRPVAHGNLVGEWEFPTQEQMAEEYAKATPVRNPVKFGVLGPLSSEDMAKAYAGSLEGGSGF